MSFWNRKEKGGVVIQNAITDSSDLMSEMASYGGVTSPDQANRIVTVNACVRVLSESIAALPCETYRRLPNGGRERATDERVYDLLKYEPNPWMDAFQFWEVAVRSMIMTGNFYSTKTMVGGKVREIVDFPVNSMTPERSKNGRVVYKVQGMPDLSPDKVFHIADALPGDGSLEGQSRIKQASNMLGKVQSAEAWSKAVFDEYGVPPGYLSTDKTLNENQRNEIRDYFKGLVGMQGDGTEKKGIPVLTEGLKYETPSISFADAQILDAMKYSRSEICALFRVPPHIAQFYENTTTWGNGIEQVALQFVSFTLLPILRRIELAVSRQLLTRKQRETLQVQFNVTSLLRGDLKARSDFYYKALLMGWMSVNDVRRLENLNPVEGGDDNRVPLNTKSLLDDIENEKDNSE